MKEGVRQDADISALASLENHTLCVLVWHYHDDDLPGASANVTLQLDGVVLTNGTAKLEHYRIDEAHSNAFAAWKHMGSPQQPSPEQYQQLEKAGQLATLGPTQSTPVSNGTAQVTFELPRQAVSLLRLTW